MDFNYKIEGYYPYENRAFVVYTPVDPAYEPLGGWVDVSPDMTETQIHDAVVAAAPLARWNAPQSTVIQALVGVQTTTPVTKTLVTPPPVVPETPVQLIARLLEQAEANIKQDRDRRKDGGVLVSGKWFHSDAGSRIQQLGLLLMGANIPAIQWKTMDGSFVTMTQTLAGQIFQGAAALDMALFTNCETHLAGVRAASDPTTYDHSTGWPASYAPFV